MKVDTDRAAGTVTIRMGIVSETISRKELMAKLGIPNPRVNTKAILRAYSQNVTPEQFRVVMLDKHVPKGSVSKMEQVLASLIDGRLDHDEVKSKSLNWAYGLIKKGAAK